MAISWGDVKPTSPEGWKRAARLSSLALVLAHGIVVQALFSNAVIYRPPSWLSWVDAQRANGNDRISWLVRAER